MPCSSPLGTSPISIAPHVLSLWRETQQACSPLSVLSVRGRFAILLTSAYNSLALAEQASEQSLHGEPLAATWFAGPGSMSI